MEGMEERSSDDDHGDDDAMANGEGEASSSVVDRANAGDVTRCRRRPPLQRGKGRPRR